MRRIGHIRRTLLHGGIHHQQILHRTIFAFQLDRHHAGTGRALGVDIHAGAGKGEGGGVIDVLALRNGLRSIVVSGIVAVGVLGLTSHLRRLGHAIAVVAG